MDEYNLNNNNVDDPNDKPDKVDFKQIAKDIDSASIIISACRRSGKTYLCREIMRDMCSVYKPDLVVLFSETADFNPDFEYISPFYKFNKLDEEKLQYFIKAQEELMLKFRREEKEKKKKKIKFEKRPFKISIIFDDVAHDRKSYYSEAISKLFILGRHIKICPLIFLTQHLTAISPKMRNNADVIITFKDPSWYNRKLIQEQFMTLSSVDRKYPQVYMDKCLGEEYRAMVVKVYNIQKSHKLSDFIGWYKAKEKIPDFKLGLKQYWDKKTQDSKKKHLDMPIDSLKFS